MGVKLNLTNKTFVRLTVIAEAGRDKHGKTMWKCLCACGNPKTALGSRLVSGHTQSCGCLHQEQIEGGFNNRIHGMSGTREYASWKSMMGRCYNPRDPGYSRYGGRGITVCERWHRFENFFLDMGKRPFGMTIERKNNDLNYYLENCKWGTREEQANNTSRNRWVKHRGEKITVAQCAKVLDISRHMLKYYLNYWPKEKLNAVFGVSTA